jgi:hypothetical protein
VIKIEVTGNSIPEVADKLIAIGHSLRNTAVNDADNAARGAMQDKRDAKLEATMPELREEIVFEPKVIVGNAPSEPASSGQTEASPTAPQEASSGPSDTTPPAGELNFDTDVAPHVLALVKEKGKPAAQEILSQFGVEKASLLDPARWPELVSVLKDAM